MDMAPMLAQLGSKFCLGNHAGTCELSCRKPSLGCPSNPLNVPSFLQTDCILWPSHITFSHSQEVNPRGTGVKQAQRGRDQRPFQFNTRGLLRYVDTWQADGAMEYQLWRNSWMYEKSQISDTVFSPISWVTRPI